MDVIAILTESPRSRKYWNALKRKLAEEGSQLSQNMGQLKMQSADGKYYNTDVANTEQLLHLIQSIPSPKAEPFKIWLANVGYERIEETEDPELAFDRAMETYLKKGYSKEWVNQRLKSIEVRKELTDEWDDRGIKKVLENIQSGIKYYSPEIMEVFFQQKSIVPNKPHLTRREKQILLMIYNESTNNKISEKLSIAISTVETHRRNLFVKLKVKSQSGLVREAIRHGIYTFG